MSLLTRIASLRQLTVQEQEKALLQILKQNEAIIVDANIEQMMEGDDATGKPLKPYASKEYAALKKKLNPRGVTDLHLTGNFQDGMFLEVDKFPAMLDSTDEKTKELKDEYGDIFGLTEKNLSAIIESDIKQDAQSYYRTNMVDIQ